MNGTVGHLISEASWPLIVGGFALGISAFSANMAALAIINKIKARIPEYRKTAFWFWDREVRSDYKRLYPSSNLVHWFDISLAMMAVLFCALDIYLVHGK